MKIFITGGSGFIGGHLIERLARHHEVLALARSDAAALTVRRYGATPVRGDLESLKAEDLGPVDVVVHAAAYVKSYGSRAAFVAGNVDGTRRVLEAAKAAGAKRFIHISTEAILFDGKALKDVDETTPPPVRQRYHYSETKADAERWVLNANGPGFVTLALRPRLVWGPRDAAVLPEIVEAAKRGAFAWIDSGQQQTSTTYVGNLAAAVEHALTQGRGGEAYFIADDGTHTLRPFLSSLAQTQGVTLPSRSVPGWFIRPLASFVESLWSLLAPSSKPPLVAFSVAMLSRTVTVKTDKARAELGYVPEVSFEEGLRRMVQPA